MTTPLERLTRAMRDKRRELIAQPLDRIWDELALVAVETLRDEEWFVEQTALDGSLGYSEDVYANWKFICEKIIDHPQS